MNENVNQLVKLQNENISGVTLNAPLQENKVEVIDNKPKQRKMSDAESLQKMLLDKAPTFINFLDGSMNKYERIISAFIREVINNNLMRYSTQSILNALEKCCKYNLLPGTDDGKIYLCPYGQDLKAVIGYKGYLELIMRNPDVEFCNGDIVHSGDEFKVTLSDNTTFTHIPNFTNAGDLLCTYAYVKYKSGNVLMKVARLKEDIERSKSFAKTQHVWSKHYNSMALAVAFRKLANAASSTPIDYEDYE